MSRPLRIAMLTHSTNPRGGVVHALQLSEALTALGHDVVLHAPDPKGKGFFRRMECGTASVAAGPAATGMTSMVEQRIGEYVRHFEAPAARDFDLFHAHDGISGNALATLRERGLIGGFLRTVHHIDSFDDPRLMALQERSIVNATQWACVGEEWQAALALGHGLAATCVGNGVDRSRYCADPDATDTALREQLALGPGPIFLVVGGVEARKNTNRILDAFVRVHAAIPDAQLVIAGGASILDHSAYRDQFNQRLVEAGVAAAAVHLTGPIADGNMPALYRLATALVFASVKEGFGLCVLEAMASGTPVIVSSTRPFTDYLAEHDAIWCDPLQAASIADAMVSSLQPRLRQRLVRQGHAAAARHDWQQVASLHLPLFHALLEPVHA